MTKDLHVIFNKMTLDSDHVTVLMNLKDLEGEDVILHFSNSERVELLHQIQNNIYNTRQEFKQFLKQIAKEKENQEIEARRLINEARAKDLQEELRKTHELMLKRKEMSKN